MEQNLCQSLLIYFKYLIEQCQRWFLKHVCFVPDYAPSMLLLKLSGLNFNESEIPVKRLLLMGRLITEPKIAPAVRTLFDSRVCFFLFTFTLYKFNLNTYFQDWHVTSIFPSHNKWKTSYTKRFLPIRRQ